MHLASITTKLTHKNSLKNIIPINWQRKKPHDTQCLYLLIHIPWRGILFQAGTWIGWDHLLWKKEQYISWERTLGRINSLTYKAITIPFYNPTLIVKTEALIFLIISKYFAAYKLNLRKNTEKHQNAKLISQSITIVWILSSNRMVLKTIKVY